MGDCLRRTGGPCCQMGELTRLRITREVLRLLYTRRNRDLWLDIQEARNYLKQGGWKLTRAFYGPFSSHLQPYSVKRTYQEVSTRSPFVNNCPITNSGGVVSRATIAELASSHDILISQQISSAANLPGTSRTRYLGQGSCRGLHTIRQISILEGIPRSP